MSVTIDRCRTASARAASPSPIRSPKRTALRGLLMALVAVAACSGSGGVPPELIGSWTTDDARYEGRAFRVTETSLTIFTAPEEFSVYRIQGARREVDGGDVTVSLEYEDANAEYVFRLSYGPSKPNGEPEWIHPASQPEIEWKRSEALP